MMNPAWRPLAPEVERLQTALRTASPSRHGLVPRCQGRHGCHLGLTAPFVCIHGDRTYLLGRNEPKPDCIIAVQHPLRPGSWVWVVVELTVAVKQPGEIAKQIRAGANAIRSHGLTDLVAGEVIPVYLERRGRGHVAQRSALGRPEHRIEFGDQTATILTGECGASLIDVMSDLERPADPRRRRGR